jgi:uncharacterized repeat protein (TIGR01451 family)
MSDRVSGRPSRVSMTSRIALVLGVLALVAGPAAPMVGAAAGLTITTPFPEVVAEPGSTATFKLDLSADPGVTVSLSADGVPSGWTSRFRGGGTTVDSVYVGNASPTASNAPDVQFSVDIPQDAAAGTSKMTIHADGGDFKETLAIAVRVESTAGGTVSLTAASPERAGDTTKTFTFDLTIKNDTPSKATYTFDSQGPDGWTVTVAPASQAQATSVEVDAGGSGSLTASVQPPATAPAGTYPIAVQVSGGGKSAVAQMKVTITGSYALKLTTPDSSGGATPLSTTANAGVEKDFALLIVNTGTAPITNVKASATLPTGWAVTFDPAATNSLAPTSAAAPGQVVTAKIIPSKDAIAGDYVLTVTVAGTEGGASAQQDIRVRVETPQVWWIAGVVLLAAVFLGLWWVFRTYGRR